MNRPGEDEDTEKGGVGSSFVRTAELLHQTPTDTAERKEIDTDSGYIQAASGRFNREEEGGEGRAGAPGTRNGRQQSGTS